jgi:superfamily I DNA/RNA helicase
MCGSCRDSKRGLTVVGDDAQSIYSFRAATVRNILDFPGRFSPKAEIVTLERNYRSTQPILAAANAVIGLAAERFTKNLWSERVSSERPRLVNVADDTAQANYIVETILENREAGSTLKAQAVLFRASHHSASLEVELTRRNIPFVKFGGLKFLEAAHIKDVLAVLRWAQNMRDRVAGFRVAQLLPGIGPGAAGRLLDRVSEVPDPLQALSDFKPPAAAAEHWQDLEATIGMLRRHAAGWPAELDLVCRWYGPHMERIHEDAAIREADLTQLAQIASTYPSRERFLTELTLDPPDATSDEAGVPLLDEDYLILSTIHSAKGQEWTFGVPAQHGRWLPAVGPRDRLDARDRGGTQAALCRHDAGQGSASPDGAAAFLHARPAQHRRPARLCPADALHPGGDDQSVREHGLAFPSSGRGHHAAVRRARRHSVPDAKDVGLVRARRVGAVRRKPTG